jgi:hypothetical protein
LTSEKIGFLNKLLFQQIDFLKMVNIKKDKVLWQIESQTFLKLKKIQSFQKEKRDYLSPFLLLYSSLKTITVKQRSTA